MKLVEDVLEEQLEASLVIEETLRNVLVVTIMGHVDQQNITTRLYPQD